MRLLTAILIGASLLASAQQRDWVASYDGHLMTDHAWSIAVDGRGGVFVTGYSGYEHQGGHGYATVKYAAETGEELWVARYEQPGGEYPVSYAYGVRVDQDGNVFVAGFSDGCLTIKYDGATGEELWAVRYVGPGDFSWGSVLELDRSGNVVVAGFSERDDEGGVDCLTLKYDGATGEELWVARYTGVGDNSRSSAAGIAIDHEGNVAMTGAIRTGVGSRDDFITVKYDGATGAELWVARYGGSGNDTPHAVAVDAEGSFFVTGAVACTVSWRNGTRYLTLKYDGATGEELWVARYDGLVRDRDDVAVAIAVDRNGDVFVTGEGHGPGTWSDYVTIKYDGATGEQLWLARYDGPANSFDDATAIAIDPAGDVYVTGGSQGLTGGKDFTTVKYDGMTGEQIWVDRYDGPARTFDWAFAIVADDAGSVYATGMTTNLAETLVDYFTVRYNQASGIRAGESAAGRLFVRLEPNPATGRLVTLRYGLPVAGPATVQVYDVAGRSVFSTRSPGQLASGSVSLDLRGLSAGVYLVKVTAGGFSTTRQLVLQK